MRVKFDFNPISPEERRAIEARRAYQKKWRAANKEKIKAYNKKFWLKQASKQKQ